MKMNNQAL